MSYFYLVGLTLTAIGMVHLGSRAKIPVAAHILGYVALFFYLFLREFLHDVAPALHPHVACFRAVIFLGPFLVCSIVMALLGRPLAKRATRAAVAVVACLVALDALVLQRGGGEGAFAAMNVLSLVAPLVASLIAVKALWRFRVTQREAFPGQSPVPVAWIAAFVAANMALATTFMVEEILQTLGLGFRYMGLSASILVIGAFILHAAMRGFRLFDAAMLESVRSIQRAEETPPRGVGPREGDLAMMARLDAVMQAEQPYVNPDLGVTEIAERLGETPGTVTAAIRAACGESFKDYVNRHRVRHCMEGLRAAHRQKNILNMAFDAGFNSKATFYRCFGKYAGCTPREYLARHGLSPDAPPEEESPVGDTTARPMGKGE